VGSWGGGRELERGGGAGRGDSGGRERVGGRAELSQAGGRGGASSAAAEAGRTARISRQVEDRGGTFAHSQGGRRSSDLTRARRWLRPWLFQGACAEAAVGICPSGKG
jgi:hypothetical protein